MKIKYLMVLILTISIQGFGGENMRETSKIKINKAKLNSKGTILLIQGTAAQNIDGQLPDAKIQKLLV